jgi:hypothetical protein
MSRLATIPALSFAVLLSGCGASHSPNLPSTPSPAQPSGTPSIPNIAGNWQFNATSNIPGNPPLTFAGNISQTNSEVSGALHVDGSNCFNQLTIMGLTGAVSAGSTSLTSTALNGQVVTFTFSNTTFTGTYKINGGCDAGDQGSVTGANVSLANADGWSGTFTSSAQKAFNAAGNFAQSTSASPEGSLGITGTATFDTPCFSAATISAGSYPAGNFILGTLVSLQIETDNGTVAFLGTVNPPTEIINGTYSVVGGTCDQAGTAVLALGGQWDY